MILAMAINLIFVAVLVAALTLASPILGPRRKLAGEKGLPYETGMPPLVNAEDRMWVSYYRFAVLFVIFDVDLAFLIPWIMLRRDLDAAAMLSMSVFVGLIAFTWIYLWRKGVLECR